jgi:hypothetical protein
VITAPAKSKWAQPGRGDISGAVNPRLIDVSVIAGRLPAVLLLESHMSQEITHASFDIRAYVRANRGAPHCIARACGIHPRNVWRWRRVPAWHVYAVSRTINVPAEILRPDVFNLFHTTPSQALPKYLRETGRLSDAA